MQLAGDVRGRHNDGKRLLIRIWLRLKAAAVHPHLVDPGLHIPGVIDLGSFFSHSVLSFSEIRQNKRPALSCRKSKTGRTINIVRGTTCVRRGPLRTQNLITAANRCRLLSLGGKTPERLPPCRHGNLHRPFPLWASRTGVLLSIIVCCNIAVFYCIFCQKSRENASPCLSRTEDICYLFPASAAKNHTIF